MVFINSCDVNTNANNKSKIISTSQIPFFDFMEIINFLCNKKKLVLSSFRIGIVNFKATSWHKKDQWQLNVNYSDFHNIPSHKFHIDIASYDID